MKTIKDREMSGAIKIIIGDKVPYNSEIDVTIVKDTKKKIGIPSANLKFYTQNEENCSVLEDLFNKLFVFFKDMIAGEEPDLQEDMELIDLKVTKNTK